MSSILVVEDDAQIRKFLRISLQANGFEVVEARTAHAAVASCAEHEPDLVVLDLGLPGRDGHHVIVRLREWTNVPIIVLSVRSDDLEKVAALDEGANDYVTKPFSIAEFMARVRALLRFSDRTREERSEYRSGDLLVDLAKRLVMRGDVEVGVSPKEYALLRFLIVNSGRVVRHEEILSNLWGISHSEDVHYLRVLVNHLRRKLRDEPANPRYIHTVQGVGYRFAALDDGTDGNRP
jgi:two-component system KDP operon response regulator KdpE